MAPTITGIISGKYFKRHLKAYCGLFREYIASIQNNTEPPISLEQTIQTITVLEAIKRSITSNHPIDIEELIKEFNFPSDLINRLLGQVGKGHTGNL